MPPKTTIKYYSRDFDKLKQDLIEYAKLVYPDTYSDFSEASVGMMLIEMVAYVGDVLSYHLDKRYNEMFLETAQQRSSLIRLSNNLGYKVQGKRASACLVDLEITVPVSGNSYDQDYALSFEAGMKLQSTSGIIFEVLEEVDFNSDYSFEGTPNREVCPVTDSNGNVIEYILRKQVIATAGESTTDTLEVTADNVKPYMTWKLKENNIIEIRNLIDSDVATPPTTENEWVSDKDRIWEEVDYLGESRVFVDTSTGLTSTNRTGYWKEVQKRFVANYDELSNLTITFGAGILNFDLYNDWLSSGANVLKAAQVLNNSSMGVMPTPGTYLHVRYRVGGGFESNVAANTITKILSSNVSNVPGVSVNAIQLAETISSLSVNNPIPAIGGRDEDTDDDIRFLASSNFAAQERVVTLDDYISRIQQMPAQYGTVFRAHANNDQSNSITRLYILTKDENGKLKNTGNELIKRNLAAYLEHYRLLNDIIEIHDGRIINIGIDFAVLVERGLNKQQVIFQCINELKDYFNIDNWQMAQTIHISKLVDILQEVQGVVNVSSIKLINKFGEGYSSDILPRSYLLGDPNTRTYENTIIPINNSVQCSMTGMFEVKYPTRDIIGRAI